MTRLTLTLSEQEIAALKKLAANEMRGLKEQARYLLRASLIGCETANLPDSESRYAEAPTHQLAMEGGRLIVNAKGELP